MSVIGYSLTLCSMLVQLLAKYMSRSIDLPNNIIIMVRASFVFAYILPLIFVMGGSILNTNNLRLQILRSILGSATIYCTYTGYQNLPFAVAASIGGLEPMFVAIWGFLLGHESRKSFLELLPIAFLGFISIIFFSVDKPFNHGAFNYTIGIGSMVLANVICSSIGYLVKIINKTDKTITTITCSALFTSSLMSCIVVVSSYFGHGFDFSSIPLYRTQLSVVGICAVFSSWFIIQALRYVDPNESIAISNLSLPISCLVGFFASKESLSPFALIGTLGSIMTVYLITGRKVNHEQSIGNSNLTNRRNIQIGSCYLAIALLTLAVMWVRRG